MTPELVTTIGQQALWVTIQLAAPLLLSALAVGLLVGMFQAATQINEMTLSFIPKLLVTVAVLMFGGPYIIRLLMDFTLRLYEPIPGVIG